MPDFLIHGDLWWGGGHTNSGFGLGTLGHIASALPPKELETEISHVDINPC